MMYPHHTDAECPECGREALVYRLMEVDDGWRVYAECSPSEGCDHDYGEIDSIEREDLDDPEARHDRARDALASLA